MKWRVNDQILLAPTYRLLNKSNFKPMKSLLFALLLSISTSVLAGAKIVSVIIPFSPGGPTDQLWRTIEPPLNDRLAKHGIRLITENLPGAAGAIAANKIAKTTDRLVLGFFSPALAIAPSTIPDSALYTADSFKLIGYAGATEMILVSPLTIDQFQKKCKDGTIFFGSSNVGSTSHLLGTVVSKEMNCKDPVHVPYKGLSAAYIDLTAGRIDFLVDFAITADGHVSSGNINKLFSMNEKFPNNLENWHVFISNKTNDSDLRIIEQEFNLLKNDQQFVAQLEKMSKIKNFKLIRNHNWLSKEFEVYKKFIDTLK